MDNYTPLDWGNFIQDHDSRVETYYGYDPEVTRVNRCIQEELPDLATPPSDADVKAARKAAQRGS